MGPPSSDTPWDPALRYRRGNRTNLMMHLAMMKRATPLLFAARRGDASAVRVLLAAGADARARNALGLDAVAVSRLYGPFPVVEQMLTEHLEAHPEAEVESRPP
jgi:hypothetical protein